MLKPKLLPFHRFLLATLIVVSLLLPALHFHPADEHTHGAAAHRHGIVHADFFNLIEHQTNHKTADHEFAHFPELESPWSNNQFDLVALTSPQHKFVSNVFQILSLLLWCEEQTAHSEISSNGAFFKQDHPPPIPESYPSPSSPRSPPLSA